MRAVLLASLLALSTPALAQAGPAAPAAVLPTGARVQRLDNGLQVVILPLATPKLVAVQTWMDVGSRDEVSPGTTGYAHFFEHLMFHGTPSRSGSARENRLLELGVDENAWTSEDFTCYHLVAGSDGLAELLAIEADRFANLHLTAEGVARESGAVYGEFRKGRASPENRVYELLYATAFTAHTYQHSTLGYEADIAGMKEGLAKAQGFFRTYYRPDRATLVIAGDVDPAAALALVQQSHGGWRAPPDALPAPPLPVEPRQQAERRATLTWTEGETNPILAVGWKIPAYVPATPSAAGMTLLPALLGAPVAPLHRRLVEDERLAWSVEVGGADPRSPGLLPVLITLRPGASVARVEAILAEEVAALGAEGPALEARLAAARARQRRAELLGLKSPAHWASAFGRYTLLAGGDPSAYDRHLAAVQALSATELAALARATFTAEGRTVVLLTPGGAP